MAVIDSQKLIRLEVDPNCSDPTQIKMESLGLTIDTSRAGWVYLAYDERIDRYKVGKTNNLDHELARLNPTAVDKITYLDFNLSMDADLVQAFVLNDLETRISHTRGEWMSVAHFLNKHNVIGFWHNSFHLIHSQIWDKFFSAKLSENPIEHEVKSCVSSLTCMDLGNNEYNEYLEQIKNCFDLEGTNQSNCSEIIEIHRQFTREIDGVLQEENEDKHWRHAAETTDYQLAVVFALQSSRIMNHPPSTYSFLRDRHLTKTEFTNIDQVINDAVIQKLSTESRLNLQEKIPDNSGQTIQTLIDLLNSVLESPKKQAKANTIVGQILNAIQEYNEENESDPTKMVVPGYAWCSKVYQKLLNKELSRSTYYDVYSEYEFETNKYLSRYIADLENWNSKYHRKDGIKIMNRIIELMNQQIPD